MRGAALAVAVAAALAGAAPVAGADPDDAAAAAADAAAGEAFRAASRRAIAGEPGAADALEALGAARPITRWTDDAWAEAARLAERAGDFARARRAHAQVIAVGTDAALVARSRAALARLEAATGAGAWDAVAAEHDRLVAEAFGGGDPGDALRALEALVARHPAYPRATLARLAIAQGWELEGEGARALAFARAALASAAPADRTRAGLALARTAIRLGELDEAGATLDALAREPGADVRAIARVRERLADAEDRAWIRRAAWLVLAALALAAAAAARRLAGGWRAAARALVRPPVEVLFVLPVVAVLAIAARGGNPLVARAVTVIAIGGIAVAWISGALLEAARRARGRVGAPRAAAHALLALVAVAAAVYIAVDHDRMIDLVIQTWTHGHER